MVLLCCCVLLILLCAMSYGTVCCYGLLCVVDMPWLMLLLGCSYVAVRSHVGFFFDVIVCCCAMSYDHV